MNAPVDATDQLSAELELHRDADRRARAFTAGIGTRPVCPGAAARHGLIRFDESFSASGYEASDTLALLDSVASPAAVTFNDPRYFGFVIGATLPAAAAAERLVLAWDQAASDSSVAPAPAAIEAVASRWCLEILDLPRTSAVGFTSGAWTSFGLPSMNTGGPAGTATDGRRTHNPDSAGRRGP